MVEISSTESTGHNLKSIKSVKEVFSLMWNQTWPLFMPPHNINVLMLSILTFILFLVSFGLNMWFPQITAIYQTFLDLQVTTCDAIQMGFTKEPIQVITDNM